ncbi:MAG: phosphodiesterase [Rhodoferax sp.]|nr:phosphodiesterase [Rhodoferax sp.]NCP54991.1 phosphodiesterase [Rhodoferax sp.]PIW09044.1 MAG: diguanylate phosphodiesterase [Comamonadaceae bacterium CG17_big_fil_post_rev_8_21_14_2_50_60_13]PIY23394.1 MAG: diguanylate phosphodiesterase [Comamonadaceae bacterium CG_4_10_14_3_um_filter_60_75]PJC17418.1 MAG: diguanylate phosphodiesterase [Comamonadaceae bacterium CG_4_9_14_0_8_um_filter_60_18]
MLYPKTWAPTAVDIATRPAIPSQPGVRVTAQGGLARVLQDRQLHAVFQPIVDLRDGGVHAHEALIRGPVGTPLHSPDALLSAAAKEGLGYEFEMACIVTQLHAWGKLRQSGRLFLNISAEVMVELVAHRGIGHLLEQLSLSGVLPRYVVLEITEHERVKDMDRLDEVVSALRETGISIALDDFGDGRSSLRLWSQLRPEIVKIDKYFVQNISATADKLKTVRALLQIADIFETSLVAEGIENAQDLRVIRDLDVRYCQGFFLGRPESQPLLEVGEAVTELLNDAPIAVYPESAQQVNSGLINGFNIIKAPTVTPKTTNNAVASIFQLEPNLHAVAVLEKGRPVAIINRLLFMNQYAKLYYRDLSGRKSCMENANTEPRLIEKNYQIDELVGILTSEDQRYLTDGFIVTDNGCYLGLGTGDQLVRNVTESRIEAARHANPLTFLPGNIPITQHIERLLRKQTRFVACYADLNSFKPFNDCYGYWRGDAMIRLLASVIKTQCDAQRDFLGHVGGDDFIVLFQSPDWRERCQRIIAEFNAQAVHLFEESARLAGGIEAEDRQGVRRFFPLTTLSIGAVVVPSGQTLHAEDVANQAALAKHDAKLSGDGFFERMVA